MNKKNLSENYLLEQKGSRTNRTQCRTFSQICVIYNGWDKKKVLNPMKGGQKPRFDCIVFFVYYQKEKNKNGKVRK